MRKANVSIRVDADTVQRLVGVGGLELPAERAKALLPLFSALMASWNRLSPVDPGWAGRPAPEGERKA